MQGRGISKAALEKSFKRCLIKYAIIIGPRYWFMAIYHRVRKTQLNTSANVDRTLNPEVNQKANLTAIHSHNRVILLSLQKE